jgi:hypothetical protein
MASLMFGLVIFNAWIGWMAWNWASMFNFLGAVFMLYLARLHLVLGERRRVDKTFDEIRQHWMDN